MLEVHGQVKELGQARLEDPLAIAKQGKGREVEVEGRRLALTNLDKVLWPTGFAKGEAIDYYARIAPAILPHLSGRALTRVRFPNGTEGQRFYEKRAPSHTPGWVRTAPIVMGREGELNFVVCDELATLTWLGQLAAMELHPSLSKVDDFENPTVVAFDLDPGPPADAIDCCRVALRLRDMFAGLGLECFPKTSGSKGLQVYLPLNSKAGYERTKPFAHAVARTLEKDDPKKVISKMKKDLREDKVFVDWSQNDRAKTTVAVYSLRARERPTISTPLRWEEVEAATEHGDPERLRFEPKDVLARVDEHGDLFGAVLELAQELPEG
ncbi:MAG: non-homologous end-joining DNA ligase [Solirubrobacterales bacterium]